MELLKSNEVYTEIGKRIRTARKNLNMTQEKLAVASGIDRSYMGFIEQGRRRPTLSTLIKITQALKMPLEQLFKGL